jgi:pimeloyl-ACP methyl ester carboxylesterase
MANEERPILRTEEEAWDIFRIGPPDGYATLQPFAGCLFPVEHLSELSRQQVPRWPTTTSPSVVAISALVAAVGPCVVIAHSQGGGIAAGAAAERPTDIAALVLLEPHGLPTQSDRLPTMPQLIIAGDFIDLSPLYQALRRRWREYLDTATDGGAIHEYFDLPAMDHPGNSHMIMMDANSDGVAALVGEWIDEVVLPTAGLAGPVDA